MVIERHDPGIKAKQCNNVVTKMHLTRSNFSLEKTFKMLQQYMIINYEGRPDRKVLLVPVTQFIYFKLLQLNDGRPSKVDCSVESLGYDHVVLFLTLIICNLIVFH
jgi:hypothetical protein